jgi:hypothetical protein
MSEDRPADLQREIARADRYLVSIHDEEVSASSGYRSASGLP